MDIDAINKQTTDMLGYPVFGYWHFFNSEDAGEIMTEKVG